METNLLDDIQLLNTDGVGPVSFYRYLEKYGSSAEALKVISSKKEIFPKNLAVEEIKTAEKENIHLISFRDKEYPLNLKQLNDAPPILYAKGEISLLQHPVSLAVVGSRNASVSGRKIASRISYDLTNADVLIISGMARGIDSAAHKGALYAKDQCGPTIAVLGTGINLCYPEENQELYEQIASQGLLISEFALNTKANISNFPRRNRIVSALSCGILVVEASLNSGSLITARLGLEQGKDIFAVPDSPIENKSAGCNKLIKEGALLVESAEDILQTLALTQNQTLKTLEKTTEKVKPLDFEKKEVNIVAKQKSSPEIKTVLKTIGTAGLEQDELIRCLNVETKDALALITELELDGLVNKQNGSFLSLTKEGLRQIK